MENNCKYSELPSDAMVSSVPLFKLVMLLNEKSLCKCIYRHDGCASMQYCRFYTQSFRFVSQYYVRLSLLSRKTSSVNLFLQLQKMLRLYTAKRRLMFHVHRESKQRQTTAWMIVTKLPSWWWILVLRTQNFEFFENCIMCRGSADLLKGHGTDTPTIWAYTI